MGLGARQRRRELFTSPPCQPGSARTGLRNMVGASWGHSILSMQQASLSGRCLWISRFLFWPGFPCWLTLYPLPQCFPQPCKQVLGASARKDPISPMLLWARAMLGGSGVSGNCRHLPPQPDRCWASGALPSADLRSWLYCVYVGAIQLSSANTPTFPD